MKKTFGQSERRQNVRMTDQYGRKWETTWDVVGKGPCAPINPYGWTDPLATPQKFLRSTPDSMNTLEVLLAEMVTERKEAYGDWMDRLQDKARLMSPETGGTALMGNEPPATCKPALLAAVGRPPLPWQPVEAAAQGNKYCLGQSPNMPKWAIPYFKVEEAAKPKYANAEDEDYGDDDDSTGFAARFKVDGVTDEGDGEGAESEDELEKLLDIEEAIDPTATGGTVIPVRRGKRAVVR